MRPPEFTGGNYVDDGFLDADAPLASMRPPEFTGGNASSSALRYRCWWCFNEAAGIHRRKRGKRRRGSLRYSNMLQ